MGNYLPDPPNRRAASRPQTLRSHSTDHARLVAPPSPPSAPRGVSSCSPAGSSAPSVPTSARNSEKGSLLTGRLEPLVILRLVGNDKLDTAVIGHDFNVHQCLQVIARLLVDHLIQQTINKQTKFTAIYTNLPVSEQSHASPHPYTACNTVITISSINPLPPFYQAPSSHPLHSHNYLLIHSPKTIQKQPFSSTLSTTARIIHNLRHQI